MSATDDDELIIDISIVHGGFENADYPLMVGSFEGEHLSSAERYLDRQFNGALAARVRIGQYPEALGTCLFIPPADEDETPTEPPGAYVVGLGPAAKLGRSELADTVRQAVVRRCVELYSVHDDPPDAPGDVLEVGLSTTLVGVRSGEALRVEDSVVGIVEGVLAANRELAEFEDSRGDLTRRVRVTALQLIERYADRCDLGAAALRSLATSIPLSPGYQPLRSLVVDSRPGGRPAGAELIENAQRFRRFLITERPTDGAQSSGRTLHLDVAVLGGAARSDRVHHRLDRVMVDALLERLASDSADTQAAATLYDQLVPQELREQFLTSAAIHFVLDATTANFPWELTTVPRPTGRKAMAAAGGIIRQFSESELRRNDDRTATSGGALVLGAGKVPGYPELPGVYAEVADVAGRLAAVFPTETIRLHDEAQPLDLVDVQNVLFGEYRVLHIAGHGVYVEDRPDETGVVLSEHGLLTVDMIRQLSKVPEVVFLSCCSLGRIGKGRLAAGLAREFMAAGARAVIAAGWPVTDAAALAFAGTFYQEFLNGRAFGDAIARARLLCDEADDSRTWAAYQCYGDPAYLLQGGVGAGAQAFDQPVSESDLIARLEALASRISDLGRSGRDQVESRRQRLLESWRALESWSAERVLLRPMVVDRLLTATLHDLGEIGGAMDRYLRHIEFGNDPTTKAPRVFVAPSLTPSDLLSAASCIARCSQRTAAEGSPIDADGVAEAFDRAELLARAASSVSPGDRSRAVLADVLVRRATAQPERRMDLLLGALDVYQDRDGGVSSDYPIERVAQLTALRDLPPSVRSRAIATVQAVRRDRQAAATGSNVAAAHRVDQRVTAGLDFASRALRGDEELTSFMDAQHAAECASRARVTANAYEEAFCARSTWSQRHEIVGYLNDLHALLTTDDERRPFLAEIVTQLREWEGGNEPPGDDIGPLTEPELDEGRRPTAPTEPSTGVGESPEPTGEGELPPAVGVDEASAVVVPGADTSNRAGALGALGVSLTAYDAGCGDALLLRYSGIDNREHQMLIDGGLRSAFDRGLGAALTVRAEGATPIETLVVTHIDADHIEGAIEAVRAGMITPTDVWFNGIDEIKSLDRGARQGDELTTLIPSDRRNKVVDGGAIFLPDQGPLPRMVLPGGAICTVLGPTVNRLRKLARAWGTPKRGDADAAGELIARLSDDGRDAVRGAGFGRDSSVANGSSIAFLFEHGTTRLLFTGDAFADDLADAIRRVLEERQITRLELDVFKVPHHGSRGNVNEALLGCIAPKRVLICTDGSRFEHPDLDAVELMRHHLPTAEFYFTVDNPHIRERAAACNGIVPEGGPVVLEWVGV